MGKLNMLTPSSRTTEADSVSDNIITEYKKNDWSGDAYLTGIFTRLEYESQRLTGAIKRIKTESRLEEKDEKRDTVLRSFFYLVYGLTHHPDEPVRIAALKVNAVLEHYGLNITVESYSIESSLVNSLITDLSAPEIVTAINVLPGVSELVQSLNTAQTEFTEASVIYEEEKAEDGTMENASEIKKTVVEIINNELVVYLRAMVQVDETKYGEFARVVSGIIDENNSNVKSRRSRPEQEETSDS